MSSLELGRYDEGMAILLSIKSLATADWKQLKGAEATYVGIDFGTSTTVVSYSYYDELLDSIKCDVIPIRQKEYDGAMSKSEKLPTVIALYDNQILVGTGASSLKYELEKNKDIWYSFKMELGEDLGPKYYNSTLNREKSIQIQNAKDATSVFFRFLKKEIENFVHTKGLNDNIKYAVSIPASFEANQRRDLIEALSINQIDVSKQALIDEPNAAFLSYILDSDTFGEAITIPNGINPKMLVFDFGAGTCDISILEIGVNRKGVYSKNLSISKFEKLGGDDIDRYIAYNILYPELLVQNGLDSDDFIMSEKRKIVNNLLVFAEKLKIGMCKAINLIWEKYDLSTIAQEYTIVVKDIHIESSKGVLSSSEMQMTSIQFAEVMKVFTRKTGGVIKDGQEYNSIYQSIKSSIKKSGLSTSDIDYVLFIGGSSMNPYVQASLKKWLPNSKLLLPCDTQEHVSKGASIHSLIYNALGLNIVQPITSEPICVVTQNNELLTLVPAGMTMPTDIIEIDNLAVARNGQQIIEIPICISNENKLLTNLVITSENPDGFSMDSPVKLILELTADKLLTVRAEVEKQICWVNAINPFANKELTTQERIALKAEKDAYRKAAENHGRLPKKSLMELAKAYEEAKMNINAAEAYEECNELYPKSVSSNRIGICYSNAQNWRKALYYGEMDYEENRNSTSAFNLGYRYKNVDTFKYLKYINEALDLSPDKPHALFELGRYEKAHGKEAAGEAKIRKAYNIWKSKYDAGTLSEVDYTWLPSAATELGYLAFAEEVREKSNKMLNNSFYNSENTTVIKESDL